MRILVVEDDSLVADAIRRGLCMSGFAVDCAADAGPAAAALGAEHFDLALLDIALPGTDGLTFLRRLRNSGSHLPIMILTARETLATKVQALDLGADDFLVKPFEQTELAARCRALIRRSNLKSNGQLTLGRLRIDITARQLYIDDEHIELTGEAAPHTHALGDPEIQKLDQEPLPRHLGQEDVGGLQVAVNDVGLVRGEQS